MKCHRQLEVGAPITKVGRSLGTGFDRAHQFVNGDGHGTRPKHRSGERPAQELSERTPLVLREELRKEMIANSNTASIADDVELARRGVADPVVEKDLDVVGEADHTAATRIEESIALIEMAKDP